MTNPKDAHQGQDNTGGNSPSSESKAPAFQFYPKDWLSNSRLRLVSPSSRGVWIGFLCLMWSESNKQGYLLIGDDNPSVSDLSMALSIPELDILRAIQELERRGVYSRTEDGVIYCPDMLKKVETAKRYAQFGKKGGGNPSLKSGGYKPPFKGGYKPPFKPNGPSASSSASACIPLIPLERGTEEESSDPNGETKPASGFFAGAKAAIGGQAR